MLRFSGSSQNPGSSVLDELQLSNGLLWKAGEETITIIHPAGDKGMNKFYSKGKPVSSLHRVLTTRDATRFQRQAIWVSTLHVMRQNQSNITANQKCVWAEPLLKRTALAAKWIRL